MHFLFDPNHTAFNLDIQTLFSLSLGMITPSVLTGLIQDHLVKEGKCFESFELNIFMSGQSKFVLVK